MTALMGTKPVHAESIDWLFAQLPGDGLALPPGLPDVFADGRGTGGLLLDAAPTPPPSFEDPTQFQAAYDWLQKERRRMEAYTRHQIGLIRKQHHALMEKHFKSEENIVLRYQELHRELEFQAAQAQALQLRARDLCEREAALADQMQRFCQAQEELLRLPQLGDFKEQQARLEALREETARLQAAHAAAQAQFDTVESALRERQQAWEKKNAELARRQAEMERRYQAVVQAEEATRRQQAELEEVEERLRQECEEQERRLARERQEIDELRRQILRERRERQEVPVEYEPDLWAKAI